ncbi:MAG: hypothetical protein SV775_17995, partial [Thermodesulfobacteriota bacterium]|nr:hypothetical protein [Thermodesulfobacteriota bacterium]
DFDESYILSDGEFSRNCQRLQIKDREILPEIPPAGYFGRRYRFFRASATFRYLRYRRQIRFSALKNIVLGNGKQDEPSYQANINVSGLDKKSLNNRLITEYVFFRMRDLCQKKNADLLIVMDGDRGAIHENASGSADYLRGPLSLNTMAKSVADEYGIGFVDLHQVFGKDFIVNHRKFNFSCDMHWNQYGHKVAAEAIAAFINRKLFAQKQEQMPLNR